MSSLTGQIIYQYYGDILTTTNLGQGLSATLEAVQDGLGQSSPMQISLNAVNFNRSLGNTFQLDTIDLIATATDINSVAKPNPILPGTGGVTVPNGTTAQRDATPHNGELRYNIDTNALEAYQNGVWGNLQAGAVVGPGASVANDIVLFGDTTGKLLIDSGVQISTVVAPLLSLGRGSSLVSDVQISGVDILNFGSSGSNDVGLIFRQSDYVAGIFPNTITNKFPNTVFGFANPSSTDAVVELTEGALLLSRLTQTQINALVPIDGMLVYNLTTEAFNFYQNMTWVDLATGSVLTVSGTANEITTTGTSSVVVSIANNPTLPGTEYVLITSGTTVERPGSPSNGMFRYNLDLHAFEGYQNSAWETFGLGGGSVTSITAGSNLTGGTITSTGTIALSDTVSGLSSLDSDLLLCLDINILANAGVPGFINFYNAANSHFVSFTAPATITSSVTWQLPGIDGTMGQALTTDGAGVLSWAASGDTTAKYIVQTTDANLPNAQALDLLGSAGLLKINTAGVVQLAVADTDYATEATLIVQVGIAEAAAVSATASEVAASASAGAAGASAIGAAASAIVASNAEGAITGATSAKFILQTTNSNLPNAQSLGALSTGLLKNTSIASIGTLSEAAAGTDYYAPGFPTTIIDTGSPNFNLFVGTAVGNSLMTGTFNTGFGDKSLTTLTTGSNNSAFGYLAGGNQTTYTNCTFLGAGADASTNALTNATAIGYNATVASSNALILGNGANVGIGTGSPTRALTVIGGQIVNLIEPSTDYTVLDSDYFTGVTSTSAPRVVTLPTAISANRGQPYVVKDQSGGANINNITINVTGGGNIDGASTAIINQSYGSLSFYSNGTQWYIW